MKTIKYYQMKTLRLILLFLAPTVGEATIIENPFNHPGELLKVNGYSVLAYEKYDANGNLKSSGSLRGTLSSKEDFGGEEIKVVKLNINITPLGGVPEAEEMYEVYIDDDFAFNNTVSSLKYSTSILNRSVGKPPRTSTVAVNQTWENIGYRTGFTEVSTQSGKILTLPIRIVIESESTFLGIQSIETIWGTKKAIAVQTQKTVKSGDQDWSEGSYNYRNTFEDTRQIITTYYLRGVGVYKIVTVTEPTSYTTSSTYVPTNYTQSYPYPSSRETEVLTYEYSTRNMTATDFTEVVQTSNANSNVALDSWTWNGAYPWVYNANTDSWFYYRFKGNACYAYDIRTSGWYAFDGPSKAWVQAN
jgi:hypothetical protein